MIRFATEKDAAAILEIFAPVAQSTATSFQTEPLSVEIQAKKIKDVTVTFPWLVFEDEGRIIGYAYASAHRSLGAYRWSCEVSVYVAPVAYRRGVGSKLYEKLFELLRKQGYYNAYAGITLPNEASVRLHESMGFERFCTFESIGYKLGKWHDVGWWKREIQDTYRTEPAEPLPIARLLAKEPGI